MTQRSQRLLILIVLIMGFAIYVVWPNSPGIHLLGINKDFVTRLGLDLVGGVQALLEADLPADVPVDSEAMSAATNIVENRVNGIGLTEAVVQQAGDRRIVVELPGETDPEAALATLQQTGLLEFVDMSSLDQNQAAALVGNKIQTDYGISTTENPAAAQTITPTQGITNTQDITATQGVTTTEVVTPTFHTVMTGADLQTVQVEASQQSGTYQVAFKLTDDGAKIFADFTAAHVGDVLAIVLDKEVISTPVINSAIPNGTGVITGNFTNESANALAVQLRYGSLPVPLKVVEIRTVGPTLGQDSLRKSLEAGLIGFTIVILFMALYYRLPGFVADFSILTYALLTFAIFRFIPVTMTLPGIAGFLLSTGSALDANILIFERMKEELRSGKTLKQAVDLGWQRAWPSIRDSNIATLITSAILFWFGSTYGATIVKGFSITLALGVLVSLFVAIVFTRVFLEIALTYFKSKDYVKWFGI
jgi:preprotein translocase subunit SecD